MANENCLVLLATYNGEKFIREQIDSILSQKKINLDILISDDVSIDNTLSIVKSFNSPRISLLPNNGKFGSASQNFFRLIRDSEIENYDYIAFADQDDIWYPDKIINSINKIKEKKISAFSSNVLAFWDDGKEKIINKSGKQKEYDYLFGSSGPGCTCLFTKEFMKSFKKELIKNRELTKKIDLHDWLVYAYARSNGFKWHTDSNITIRYRQHSNNEFGANSGFKTFLNRWKQSRNGWYRNQIINTILFCNINNKISKRINRNNYFDRCVLAKNVFKFRKKKREAIFLWLMLLIPGFK